MKLLYIPSLFAILFFSSCSKKSDPTPDTTNPNVGSVSINGTPYPTIIIGNQTWTSLNYGGGTATLTTLTAGTGSYYTLAQANAITLPTGWRIPTRADYNNLLSNFTTTKNSLGDYVGDISVARALADTGNFHSLASFDLSMKATNSSGFSAYPGGEYDITNKVLNDNVIAGAFLTSSTGTQNSLTVGYFFGITSDGVAIASAQSGYFGGIDYNANPFAYSLRFVKDN